MPMLDLKDMATKTGNIRIGYSEPRGQHGKIPKRSDTFILTGADRDVIEQAAALYGGEVEPFPGNPGEWQVRTTVTSLRVTVPLQAEEVLTQWYELWERGVCVRRCDSVTEKQTKQDCLCPGDPRARRELAAQNPPAACKPTSRLNVAIPDLGPATGVWLLTTHSFFAAGEWRGAAEMLRHFRDQGGVFLAATLRIEQRQAGRKHFPVVVLAPMQSLHQLAAGTAMADQLPPPMAPDQLALPAGRAPLQLDQRVIEHDGPDASRPALPPVDRLDDELRDQDVPEQQALILARRAVECRSLPQLERVVNLAKRYGVTDLLVSDLEGHPRQTLQELITDLWKRLLAASKAQAS